ncbi:MAG: glycosyltransferase family 39 protein [Actinobacteria bacterium]|nr:glycosyltransferase family 39 protein [Actinomycetota bacterium]
MSGRGNDESVHPGWVPAGIALVIIGGIVLRFVASSPLWLDEALSVNIAKVPLGDLAEALRHDGAPPLYYVLLKGWMQMFGSSDIAVRALSGVVSLLALPLVWLAGRRLAGRETGWTALVLVASSPFAIRYATEARMYALVILLTAAGLVLLVSFLDRPTTPRLAGLIFVTAALVHTHYWALYLAAALLGVLALRAERAQPHERRSVRFASSWAMVGIATGVLALVPWGQSFLFQVQHTGTPWAGQLGVSAPVVAVMSFGSGGWGTSDAPSILGLILVLLVIIGALGRRVDSRVDQPLVLLDLRGSSPGRNMGLVVLLTLVIATAVGLTTGSAFQPRYASVVVVPSLLLVALGTSSISAGKIRRPLVACVAALGLVVAITGVGQLRTQSGEIASVLAARSQPNDLVVYCPDQLGPAVERRLDGLGIGDSRRQVAYPDLNSPTLVDWVDYSDRMRASDPERVARRVHRRAGDATIWLVWSSAYRNIADKCGELNAHLNNVRPDWRNVLTVSATGRSESANLTVYPPG